MNFLKFTLFFCITILYFNCKTTQIITLEANNQCNFYFYIKDEIKNEIGFFNDIKIKFILNKKDYTKFIIDNLKNQTQTTCFYLKSGLQKLELKFNYTKFNSFDGKINFSLEDKDPFLKTVVILFYIDNDNIYYLSPIPTFEKKLNFFESFLNFYLIFFYPFGFFPNYDSSLKMNIIKVNEIDYKEDLKFCKDKKDNKKCNLIFEKLILENYNND